MLATRFPFFGSRASNNAIDQNSSNSYSLDGEKPEVLPSLKLATDKDVYRPGDSIAVTVEICNPASSSLFSLLIEKLGFEIKGIEKLDTQWYATQRSLTGSRQRRGEHVFMDSSIPELVSNQIVSSGAKKSYIVRTVLPDVIPPSYRGATIRYLYFVKTVLSGRWLMLENSHSRGQFAEDLIQVEARIPLQIWVTQKSNGLLVEEGQSDGIVPATTVKPDIYWKEIDGDAEWVRVNDTDEGVEEGYESSKDEVSSVSSYNPSKENIYKNFGSSSLSLQTIGRSSNKEVSYNGRRASFSSILSLPRLSMAEVSYDSSAEMSSLTKQSGIVSPHQQQKTVKSEFEDDAAEVSSPPGPGTIESSTSEGFIRGRSYNIRVDDQVLLRFSPKNSDSTYYFSDMIGGTLTFFHEEGAKRCLEVSITLETSENINRRFVHPSRRNSPTITKVQSDHQEVVADLVQTSFLFSVPMDGPMSFSTPHVSVQWVLRFEFFTTPKNVDWRRYEHPLLIEGREKSEWILPITVHAPPPGTPAAHTRNEKLYPPEPLWVRT